MKMRTLAEVAQLAGARLVRGSGDLPIRSAVIDSRIATKDSLFVALEGLNCHGIDHASAALASGAVAVLCDRGLTGRHAGASLEVDDVRSSLGVLAGQIRAQEAAEIPVLAVTGSVGKTTTCAMLGAILGESRRIHSPRDSYNNDLGVPITILEAESDTQLLILEMGTSSPGEIAHLADVARPQHAVITAIGAAHLEGLGSIEGVFREKFSLLEKTTGTGLWAPVEWRSKLGDQSQNYRWTGPDGDLEICRDGRLGVQVHDRSRSRQFSLPWNAPTDWSLRCLESAVAIALEIVEEPETLVEGVRKIQLPRWRHEIRTVDGVELILDCYNSSPEALRCSIAELGQSAATRKVAVIGTMEELGADEDHYHIEAGRLCVEMGIDTVFVVGRAASWIAQGVRESGSDSICIEKNRAGASLLAEQLRSGDQVLFKASRREKLEELADLVVAELQPQEERQGERQ
ncbi:MAG: UDP-N-acetylmuramoyl-tripeptide--D-alanyl-D-alanine ligase [Planctomycetota bacterium]